MDAYTTCVRTHIRAILLRMVILVKSYMEEKMPYIRTKRPEWDRTGCKFLFHDGPEESDPNPPTRFPAMADFRDEDLEGATTPKKAHNEE